MNGNLKLSVVIPSYNESAELKKTSIDAVDTFLKLQNFSSEVLIIDDESTNESLEVVRDYIKGKKNFKLIENEHGGKAITVMTGMLEAKGEIRLFMDMDYATPIEEINKFMPMFEEGFDIVIGSRHGRKGAPILRKIAAQGFVMLRNIILGLPLSDTQCGFKAMSYEATEKIFGQMLITWKKMRAKNAAVNAGFDVEMLFLAKKKGFKIAEVIVDWHHVQNEKQVQLLRDSVETIKDMFRIRLNDLQGKYS